MKILFLIMFYLSGCSSDPEPINYGTDQCEHCRMTIMDKKFGAEIITKKGKVQKFDAAECLINYIIENNTDLSNVSMLFVTDYKQPAKLINALNAVYVISSGIKSPMGENLCAFTGEKDAGKFIDESGGDIYNWESLTDKFRKSK